MRVMISDPRHKYETPCLGGIDQFLNLRNQSRRRLGLRPLRGHGGGSWPCPNERNGPAYRDLLRIPLGGSFQGPQGH